MGDIQKEHGKLKFRDSLGNKIAVDELVKVDATGTLRNMAGSVLGSISGSNVPTSGIVTTTGTNTTIIVYPSGMTVEYDNGTLTGTITYPNGNSTEAAVAESGGTTTITGDDGTTITSVDGGSTTINDATDGSTEVIAPDGSITTTTSDGTTTTTTPDTTTDPFADLIINSRGVTRSGFIITYDPAAVRTVTETEQYTVTAVATYIATGEVKVYTFTEWAYPAGTTVDSYGRVLVDMNTVPEGECKTYALNNNLHFVESNGSVNDERIRQAYDVVLGRYFISSDAYAYWTEQLEANNWDENTFRTTIANAGIQSGVCPIAAVNAQIYLTPTDSHGRAFIRMDTIPDSECKGYALENGIIFVQSNGTTQDTMVLNAYRTVLGREYIGSEGYDYWVNQLTTNNWDETTLRIAIANAAIATGIDSFCKVARFDAMVYLTPNDPDGRVYIKMSTAPDSECKTASLARGTIDWSYAQPLTDTDQRISTAYKTVLDRDYVSSNAYTYWGEQIVNNSWDDDTLKEAIANGALSSTEDCPIAKDNARNYLVAKTQTPTITIASSVNENSSIQGSISNYDPLVTYTISANLGTITYTGDSTFYYNAPDITGDATVVDEISIYGTKAGELQSDTLNLNISVIYVPFVSDEVIANDNFSTYETYNDGFTY